jgi:transcriptional regulator with XRE-family HTH domain
VTIALQVAGAATAARLVTFLRKLPPAIMSETDAFGPNLRRIRIQRGVSLEQIAAATKVSAALWAGLERNDLSRWPTGIYARAFIREYAHAIGVDAESTVDEFCRCYPQGDRRAEPLIRGHAQIVNHPLDWEDHVPPVVAEGDRRGSRSAIQAARHKKGRGPSAAQSAFSEIFGRLLRAVGRA